MVSSEIADGYELLRYENRRKERRKSIIQSGEGGTAGTTGELPPALVVGMDGRQLCTTVVLR